MILTKSSQDLYTEYVARMQKIADVKYAAALLQWDQETYLPVKGAAFRGQLLATEGRSFNRQIGHEWLTAGSLGDLLGELNARGDLSDDQQRNVALSLEDYTKQKKFSPAFVRLLSETTSRSFHPWIKARSANSFALFKEELKKLVD